MLTFSFPPSHPLQQVKVAALSRQVTSPLAMAIQSMLVAGADPGLAVATVVVTGVVGASVGPRILDAIGVTDGKARGLAMGVAAHGLGTAAVKNEGEAFPFAAVGMAAVGVVSTVIVAVGKGVVLRSVGC